MRLIFNIVDEVEVTVLQDIEKAYLRENKIQRRQYIISKLSQNNIEQTEKEQLEKELTNITIDLARMK